MKRLLLDHDAAGAVLVGCAAMVGACSIPAIAARLGFIPFAVSGFFLLLLCLAQLPRRIVLLGLPLTALALALVTLLNEAKISAVGLPVTSFDVKMFLENPDVLPNAVGVNPGRLYFWLAAAGVLCAAAFVAALLIVLRRRTTQPAVVARRLLLAAVVCVAAVASLTMYGRGMAASLPDMEASAWQDFWLPESQIALSRRLGPLEYLAFTRAAGSELAAEGDDVVEFDAEDVAAAAGMLDLPKLYRAPDSALPNVVIFHAESAFDPNAAFHLARRVDLPLWSERPETRLLSPLRVNVLGGGSWVSEFEVLTGVDSRLFGYQGYYTHYYIAPHVRNSFVKYLRALGYRTAAFYPVEGSFYNADTAFRQYGFASFTDARQLRLPDDWSSVRDTALVRSVIDRGVFEEHGPFFYFVSTTENHGPHPCAGAPVLVEFRDAATADETCRLNEYLRRAVSTSDAVTAVLRRLQDGERRTGRPWVLLVYGDHQPWSFTDGMYSVPGGFATEAGSGAFGRLRTSADGYQTFVHVLGSPGVPLHGGFATTPPVWFLPTLLSAFIAGGTEQLYMPANAAMFLRCGSDLLKSPCASAGTGAIMRASLLRDPS